MQSCEKLRKEEAMKRIFDLLKKQSPSRIIALGFSVVILTGAILLMMPFSLKKGVHLSFLNALFTSTSAVCVTGLVVVDTADSFTAIGQIIIAMLIQIGGLGIASVGVGLIIAAGKRVSIKSRLMVKEALNVDTYGGMVRLVRVVLAITLGFEAVGALISFIVFRKDYSPLHAIGISIFHSIAAFNNAGFDNLGGMHNLIPYKDNILLNITTDILVIAGGLGFLVLVDIVKQKRFKKLCLHSKVVVSMTAVLLLGGMFILKATEKNITWMGAFFQSMTTRTAGFSTYDIGSFSKAGLFAMCILMFIGASPGSTGGGAKTTTIFVMIQALKCMGRKKSAHAFRRSISDENISKAFMITVLYVGILCTATFLICVFEPEYDFIQLIFEVISAFSTAGLSTGITPELGIAARILLILLMFMGRVGAFTLLSVWSKDTTPNARYSEEMISIG